MRTGLVILGEKPGPNTDPERPLFPHTTTGAAMRLIRMMGVTVSDYLRFTQRYNVFNDNHREILDLEEARRRVAALHYKHYDLNPDTIFLYLGKAAISAAPEDYRDLQFLQRRNNVCLVPHPSGCNRVFNEPEVLDRTSLLLKSIWRESIETIDDSHSESEDIPSSTLHLPCPESQDPRHRS